MYIPIEIIVVIIVMDYRYIAFRTRYFHREERKNLSSERHQTIKHNNESHKDISIWKIIIIYKAYST